jgi:hypothetical protein
MSRACIVAVALLALLTGCALADDHCSGSLQTASKTAPHSAAAAAWNDTTCTTVEDELCQAALPPRNALMLCQHSSATLAFDGGALLALECHYYSDDKSCHSTTHHHPTPPIPLPPPGH